MKKMNIGILAHVDAGKTTVTENILFQAGVIKTLGRVDKGDTQTDSMELEKKRGISIKATSTSFIRDDVKINLIDTPGHVDFVAEVERSLSVLDAVILIVSAKEGIQAQTKVLIETLKELRTPVIIFINKLDRIGADSQKVLKELKKNFSGNVILMQSVENEGTRDVSIKSRYMTEEFVKDSFDIISDVNIDDDILKMYIENEPILPEMLFAQLRKYTYTAQIYPVFCGSALLSIGVCELMDAVINYLPFSRDISGKLSAVVYKIDSDEKKSYVRIFLGSISIRDTVFYNGKEEKVKRLCSIENGKMLNVNTISSGDIGILFFKDLRIGDIIGEECELLKKVEIAKPTLRVEIHPIEAKDHRRLYEALCAMSEEDPLLEFVNDTQASRMFINIFGEVQMEIISLILLEKYGLEVTFSDATTIYLETPVMKSAAVMNMGSPFNYYAAGVGFEIEPLPLGAGLVYETKVSYGDLSKTFQIAVHQAVMETCKNGVYGWRITDAKVTFSSSQYDSVSSTPADFRNLAPMVLMEAFSNAEMDLLEPMLSFELRVPEESAGKAIYDCRQMQAEIIETSADESFFIITGIVSVTNSKSYAPQLASYTQGMGLFLTKFYGCRKTEYSDEKVNKSNINIALNKKMYLMHKMKTM